MELPEAVKHLIKIDMYNQDTLELMYHLCSNDFKLLMCCACGNRNKFPIFRLDGPFNIYFEDSESKDIIIRSDYGFYLLELDAFKQVGGNTIFMRVDRINYMITMVPK